MSRERGGRVAEPFAEIFGVDVLLDRERRVRMAEVVESDARYRGLADTRANLDEGARLDERSVRSRAAPSRGLRTPDRRRGDPCAAACGGAYNVTELRAGPLRAPA
jgi:hypothetical protein